VERRKTMKMDRRKIGWLMVAGCPLLAFVFYYMHITTVVAGLVCLGYMGIFLITVKRK